MYQAVVDNLIENYPQYDYVIINDGSTDDTRKVCARRKFNFMDLPADPDFPEQLKAECAMPIIMGMTMFFSLTGTASMILLL